MMEKVHNPVILNNTCGLYRWSSAIKLLKQEKWELLIMAIPQFQMP
jgi:hypothetical protein